MALTMTLSRCEAERLALLLRPATILAMREWVSDCVWVDGDDLDELGDAVIVRGVSRHYCGGVGQFIADAA